MRTAELYELFCKTNQITTDSRKCHPGSLFFALKGDNFDGNMFAEKALQSGCSFAVTDNPGIAKNNRFIPVDNVLRALQELASYHRTALNTPVIAITGTNGKTTTKELVSVVLKKKYNILSTEGNLNNHIGVPLTLLRLTKEHQIAVIEMGASHPGEIQQLSEITKPDFGLITNVGHAHLEGFGSFEGVIKTKGELYDFLRQKGGIIFINSGNKFLTGMSDNLKHITYGKTTETQLPFIAGKIISRQPYMSFEWKEQNNRYVVKTHLIGDYNLTNALAAVCIGRYFDVTSEQIKDAIENYIPQNNRSQLLKTQDNTLIIDAYNANPSSMKASLENFYLSEGTPKAVILGDMLELGNQSISLHAGIINLLRSYSLEKVLLCGKDFTATGKGDFTCFDNVEELKIFLKNNPLSGYNILLKGSHGIHLEKIIDIL
jgi:UDP-N-acetylmuramoyl-tripeptide--D-alanyl-D-alanine ligase